MLEHDNGFSRAQAHYDNMEPPEGVECLQCKLEDLKYTLTDRVGNWIHDELVKEGVPKGYAEKMLGEMYNDLNAVAKDMANAIADEWEGPWAPCHKHDPGWED